MNENNQINNAQADVHELIEKQNHADEHHNCECVEAPAHVQEHVACHHAKAEPNPKRKRCIDFLINRKESIAIFVVTIIVIVCSTIVTLKSISDSNNELAQQMSSLRTQIISLEQQVESLQKELGTGEVGTAEKQPINITINMDGENYDFSYDGETGEAVDPNEDVLPSNPDFDTRPFLGVAFYEGNDGSGNPIGLQVDYVYQYSPAEFAGIKAGDIIMAIDGIKIDTFDDLDAVISQHAANDILDIQIATSAENGVNVVNVSATLTYRGNFDLD